MRRITLSIICLCAIILFSAFYAKNSGQSLSKSTDKPVIIWHTFEEAVVLNKKEPRKLIIDVYTDWCGWCKRMDATTFKDSAVVEEVNKHYYAVKFNAEGRNEISFRDKKFNFREELRSHELAYSLLNGKMSYPSIAYLDENQDMLTVVPGYVQGPQMTMILKYFGDNAFKTQKWEEYSKK